MHQIPPNSDLYPSYNHFLSIFQRHNFQHFGCWHYGWWSSSLKHRLWFHSYERRHLNRRTVELHCRVKWNHLGRLLMWRCHYPGSLSHSHQCLKECERRSLATKYIFHNRITNSSSVLYIWDVYSSTPGLSFIFQDCKITKWDIINQEVIFVSSFTTRNYLGNTKNWLNMTETLKGHIFTFRPFIWAYNKSLWPVVQKLYLYPVQESDDRRTARQKDTPTLTAPNVWILV